MPAPDKETSTETGGGSRWRRRLLWTLTVLAVVLLLVLTPPMINVNRLQRRIAASISASLGRPVTLDRVTLHLLPMPGFTLENLVVGEEPGFGSEPVIRANVVEVTLRPSSLWRRHVEFSSIKFEEPSLNLVRNAAGEWNVQSLLMHAASVETAPTAQRKAGPEPRFPYIEATGARVNVKLGEEKKPFSLTEADFALWLTPPQEWRVRLVGKPTRTDTNVSDPGTVKMEGSLRRAATMDEVPVDLTASWQGAPMGEASKLLTGNDAGWRGNLNVEATLVGTLAAARLTTKIHMEELRRAEFVPVATMDVSADCGGTVDVTTTVVRSPECSVATPAEEGSKTAGRVVMIADSVDLSAQEATGLRVGMTKVPDAWLLDWVRLFSQRIPANERPGGVISGSVMLANARKHEAAGWQGEFHGEINGALPWKPVEDEAAVHAVSVTSSGEGLDLVPLSLAGAGKVPALTLSGTATKAGYLARLTGTATEAQVMALVALAPPLGDGVPEVLGKVGGGPGAAARAMKIDVTCSRTWGAGQTCAAGSPVTTKHGRRRR